MIKYSIVSVGVMNIVYQLGILFLFVLRIKGDDFDYCYANDKNPYEFFSTWTNYDAVKGWPVHEVGFGCEPKYIWGLVKHGVKSFTDEEIARSESLWKIKWDVEQNDKDGRCALCWDDYQNIHSSRSRFGLDKKNNEDLAKSAYIKHELFASYAENFIDTSKTLSKDDFEFQISNVKGANDSAIKFSNQLLKSSYKNLEGNGIKENNTLLRTRKDCAKWTPTNKESDEFVSSPIFQLMRLRISYRLGFTYPISVENVTALYESCVFWNNLPAIWKPQFCAAFTPDDLKIMEYFLDLKHFYEFGYGNPLSKKMGCPLVKDMLNKLSNSARGTFGKKGTFYFADEENIMGFITKMGLYQDDKPLKHDDYPSQKQNRKWRSSLLSPSIATVHAVLYSCNNNEKKIEFYHNQNIIKIGACKSTTGNKCPLNTFIKEVENNFKEDCEEGFCGSFPKSSSSVTSCSFAVVISCYFFSKLRLI